MNLFYYLATFAFTILLVLLYLQGKYNSFIKLRNRVRTDFSDISIQLRKRAALMQNLVELVKDYAKHENRTFTQVAKARTALENSSSTQDSAKADNLLSQTLRSLMAVSESYPELKASDNYKQVKSDLIATENDIVMARSMYNTSVEKYNNAIQTFPSLLVANLFEFQSAELFQPQEIEVLKESH